MKNHPNSPLSIYQDEIEKGNLLPDNGQLEIIRLLDSLHQQLLSYPQSKKWYRRIFSKPHVLVNGYYIWGGVGTGKTMIMDIFQQSLPHGLSSRVHFHKFMQQVHDMKNSIGQEQDPIANVTRMLAEQGNVLCLDEFSVTDITDAMILSALLENMFNLGMVLVTTSNTPPDELYKDGLQRSRFLPAIKLIKSHTTVINLDGGTDYRMDYLRDDAIFHTPLGQHSEDALARCFNRLAGRTQLPGSSINISGREVNIKAAGDRIVWFEFDTLCRSSRSRMDYIAIAREYHTVVVSNLVTLDDDNNDAARRLIEMVDEFYDRNVKLIVSSSGPPESLYTGKRLAAPFRRTVSRLNEMSSNAYLEKPHLG